MPCLARSSVWETSWHHQGAAGKQGCFGSDGAYGFQLWVRVSLLPWEGFRLQGSAACSINCANCLADERWAGGGLVVTAVFSSAGHSLRLVFIPQGVIKAIKMGSVNSTEGCSPGSGGSLCSCLSSGAWQGEFNAVALRCGQSPVAPPGLCRAAPGCSGAGSQSAPQAAGRESCPPEIPGGSRCLPWDRSRSLLAH